MVAECRHILPRGTKCKAIALRGNAYCYYHQQLHTYRHDGRREDQAPLALPSIEDASGIQLALTQVMGALATGRLDPRRGSMLLYALQIAIQTLDRVGIFSRQDCVQSAESDPVGIGLGVVPASSKATADRTSQPLVAGSKSVPAAGQSPRQLIAAALARLAAPSLTPDYETTLVPDTQPPLQSATKPPAQTLDMSKSTRSPLG